MSDPTPQPQSDRRLSLREIEQMQEIVIRAHYLAMELRDICATSGVARADMSFAVSSILKSWALSFGGSLRVIDEAERGGS
jgi:hypothetical protein